MSEETANKKSRRAQRREAKQASGEVEAPASGKGPRTSKSSGKGSIAGEGEEQAGKEKLGGTSSIRSERLRAREAAVARRRKQRQRERSQAAAEGLDTSEIVDDALARGAHATTRFVQRHFKWMQWVIVLGLVGGFAALIYEYRSELSDQKATARLMKGVQAEFGRVEGQEDLEAPVSGFVDTRPEFSSNAERLKAAAAAYRKVISEDPEPERQVLAKLGLAGVLFDQGKFGEALETYREVKESPLAGPNDQFKGRAVEGIGLSLEGLGKKDDAQKAFKELENLNKSLAPLGRYHQARLLYARGERAKAKELLQKLLEKPEKDDSAFDSPGFVQLAARQLLEAIDPAAAKPPPGAGLSPEQLKKIQEQLKQAAGVEGGETDINQLMDAINKSMGEKPSGAGTPPAEPQPAPAKDQPEESTNQ